MYSKVNENVIKSFVALMDILDTCFEDLAYYKASSYPGPRQMTACD